MSGCCSDRAQSTKAICPGHGGTCREAPDRTVLQHVRTPWRTDVTAQRYYFCAAVDCPVVYFGEDGCRFETDTLRESIGQKSKAPEGMLCYCFDIRYGDAARDASLRAFVIEQTAKGLCNCESHNPSGRCCLKDFP
jgi:hypothetical protein